MYSKKLIVLLLFFLLFFKAFSQAKLVDQDHNSPIPYAHILLDNKLYTYSNLKGEFEISPNIKFDTLKVTHLSYESKLLSYKLFKNNNTIALKGKAIVLKEVLITSSKKNTKTQILLPEKSTRDILMAKSDLQLLYEGGITYTEENSDADISKAVYVPNEKKIKSAIIKKIILNSVDKKIAGDSIYIPFKVNLMTYDTINKIPKDKIFAEDLSVGKRRGENVIIDLSKENPVEFLSGGICIVVSVYRTEYYKNKGYKKPPGFHAVQIKKNSSFREYSKGIYGNQWTEQKYSQTREQCFNFGIEIEFIK